MEEITTDFHWPITIFQFEICLIVPNRPNLASTCGDWLTDGGHDRAGEEERLTEAPGRNGRPVRGDVNATVVGVDDLGDQVVEGRVWI